MTTVPARPRGGRDRRRRLNQDELQDLYLRADGRCQKCDEKLSDDWHQAHLISYANGGPTYLRTMEAWCPKCNLTQGATNAIIPLDLTLRPWQDEALPIILERLYEKGFSTLHAAPGAGKTLFAGVTFQALREMGCAERMMVVVPNANLRRQWKVALACDLRIHLDDEPRDGFLEHRRTLGCITTYQQLLNSHEAHAHEMQDRATFVTIDEVHHAGETASWGRAITAAVGDIHGGTIHAAAVLNLTGTLFRSRDRQRISTVAYRPAQEADKIEAIADYSIPSVDLIPGFLRPPHMFIYGAEATVLDTTTAEVTHGDIVDLDEAKQAIVLGHSYESKTWLEGFARRAVELLQEQIDGLRSRQAPGVASLPDPLKLLFIAVNQRAAEHARDALNKVTGDPTFARLVISDAADALKVLRRAAEERRSLAIVAVRMVSEGFDCPAVSTIAYASNITAPLSITQTMARAMRITDTERMLGTIPARVLIPNHPKLRAAFDTALVAHMHILDANLPPLDRDYSRGGGGLGPVPPRFQLLDLSAPVLRTASVIGEEEGDIDAAELEEWMRWAAPAGIPAVYGPAAIMIDRKRRRQFPRLETTPESRPADPRTVNRALRDQLKRLSAWMVPHLDHDGRYDTIGEFQALANEAGGIPPGGRDLADHTELRVAIDWMRTRVTEHCERHPECDHREND